MCHMTSSHNAEDVRIFHKECKSLHKAGYDVCLVAPGESYEKDDIHIIGIGHLGADRKERFLRVSKDVYIKALELDADIYHFHDPELIPYGVKLVKKGKHVIFDSHEHVVGLMMDRDYIPNWLRIPGRFLLDRYVRYCVKQYDAVITVTPHILRYYEQCAKRTVQIANYPIFESLPSIDGAKQERVIVFAGGISEQWDHKRIIEAIADIPGCRYVLCGSISQSYKNVLQSCPGWEKVDYLGKIPFEEVRSILSKASVGVALLLPSYNTGGKEGTIGNTKIFEEMMAELPVVCTDFDLWTDIIKKYDCGICVDPMDVDAIRQAIEWLFDNPEKSVQMGKNGGLAIEEEYNWNSQAVQLTTLYKSILCSNDAL